MYKIYAKIKEVWEQIDIAPEDGIWELIELYKEKFGENNVRWESLRRNTRRRAV